MKDSTIFNRQHKLNGELSILLKRIILNGKLTKAECNNIRKELTTATSEEKCVDIATAIHQGGVFSVKVSGQSQPSIVHTFPYAEGNAKELGYGKRKTFILSGLGSLSH